MSIVIPINNHHGIPQHPPGHACPAPLAKQTATSAGSSRYLGALVDLKTMLYHGNNDIWVVYGLETHKNW